MVLTHCVGSALGFVGLVFVADEAGDVERSTRCSLRALPRCARSVKNQKQSTVEIEQEILKLGLGRGRVGLGLRPRRCG